MYLLPAEIMFWREGVLLVWIFFFFAGACVLGPVVDGSVEKSISRRKIVCGIFFIVTLVALNLITSRISWDVPTVSSLFDQSVFSFPFAVHAAMLVLLHAVVFIPREFIRRHIGFRVGVVISMLIVFGSFAVLHTVYMVNLSTNHTSAPLDPASAALSALIERTESGKNSNIDERVKRSLEEATAACGPNSDNGVRSLERIGYAPHARFFSEDATPTHHGYEGHFRAQILVGHDGCWYVVRASFTREPEDDALKLLSVYVDDVSESRNETLRDASLAYRRPFMRFGILKETVLFRSFE